MRRHQQTGQGLKEVKSSKASCETSTKATQRTRARRLTEVKDSKASSETSTNATQRTRVRRLEEVKNSKKSTIRRSQQFEGLFLDKHIRSVAACTSAATCVTIVHPASQHRLVRAICSESPSRTQNASKTPLFLHKRLVMWDLGALYSHPSEGYTCPWGIYFVQPALMGPSWYPSAH